MLEYYGIHSTPLFMEYRCPPKPLIPVIWYLPAPAPTLRWFAFSDSQGSHQTNFDVRLLLPFLTRVLITLYYFSLGKKILHQVIFLDHTPINCDRGRGHDECVCRSHALITTSPPPPLLLQQQRQHNLVAPRQVPQFPPPPLHCAQQCLQTRAPKFAPSCRGG